MTSRDLHHLLRPPAASAPPECGVAASVRERIARGWDPWRMELRAWLKRWWPLGIAAAVLAAAALVMWWPHGRHEGQNHVKTERGPLLRSWP